MLNVEQIRIHRPSASEWSHLPLGDNGAPIPLRGDRKWAAHSGRMGKVDLRREKRAAGRPGQRSLRGGFPGRHFASAAGPPRSKMSRGVASRRERPALSFRRKGLDPLLVVFGLDAMGLRKYPVVEFRVTVQVEGAATVKRSGCLARTSATSRLETMSYFPKPAKFYHLD